MLPKLALVILPLIIARSAALFYDPVELGQIVARQANQTTSSNTSAGFLRDEYGNPTTNLTQAWYLSTAACMEYSKGPNKWTFITWNDFVPMFATWLLPWLALTAQLPYETKDKATNLMSLLLALGSPILAAYSVSLTVLNAHWINKSFREETQAWRARALRGASREWTESIRSIRWILIEMQPIPFRIERGVNNSFAQMIVRPENAIWWKNLRKEIFKTKREKTLSLFMQLGWVIAAQVLSIVQFFATGVDDNSIVLGLAINSLWAWMLPIVWGWVFVGTQNFARSIRDALEAIPAPIITDANGVVQPDCDVLIDRTDDIEYSEVSSFLGFPIAGWEKEPGPLFVYARVHSQMTACEILRKAWEGLRLNQIAHATPLQMPSQKAQMYEENIQAMVDKVANHVQGNSLSTAEKASSLKVHTGTPDGIAINFIIAGFMGLLLQWGTTGSAILIAYKTPVIGLGCDSGAYLFYGITATVVWSFLVLSARLSHLWRVQQEQLGVKPATLFSIGALAVLTRLIGNTLAILNALWVITFSILQFTNVYNNCWCASSALQWGANHYILLFPQPSQIYAIASPFWIAGTFIGIASAAICVIFFMLAKGDDLFRMDAQ